MPLLNRPNLIDDDEERRRQLLEDLVPGEPAPIASEPAVHRPAVGRDRDLMVGATAQPKVPADKLEPIEDPGDMSAKLEPLGRPSLTPLGEPPVASPDSGALQPLGHKERQALPLTSDAVRPGTSEFYQNKLQRIEDKKANPWGSAENHPGLLGKVGHVLSKIGNVAGDIFAPGTMALIPGTDLNREVEEGTNTERYQTAKDRETKEAAEEARSQREREQTETENRKLDILENKPGTPDQEAINAKMQETNPATQKPYTAYEARVELSNDTHPEKNKPAATPHTVTMLDKEGGKPYVYEYDPQGNYTGDAGYNHWKKVGPGKPEASMGMIGSWVPLIKPDGSISQLFNSKTTELKDMPTGTADKPMGTTAGGARLRNTELNQFNSKFVNNATDIETNFKKAQAAVDAYNANPKTGAAGMVLLAQHLGTTFGSVKGASTGEHMISEHQNAIGLADKLDRWLNQASTGQPLSKTQIGEFMHMVAETRQITWQVAAKEASRRKIPIDFLPADVRMNLADDRGRVKGVSGSMVQQYLDKGAKLAD